MKKNRRNDVKQISSLILFSLVFMLFYSSCNFQEEQDGILTSSNNADKTILDVAKAKLLSMGFDTLDIVDVGKYYQVENDVLVDKDALNHHLSTRQFTSNFYVPDSSVIRIAIDDKAISQTSGWTEALKEVTDIYHEYAGLDFMYVDSSPDILLTKKYLPYANVCAQGVFPSSSDKPGNFVYINSGFYKDIDSYLSHSQKVFLLMHELGHNLGLRHSDCKKNGEDTKYGMNLVPGTPESDENSYMNSSTCGKSWNGIRYYDKITLATLWPYSFKIRFVDGDDFSELVVRQQRKYYLSRESIPQKEGYVFQGWHHVLNQYTPYSYDRPITGNKTFYAKWRPKHDLVTVNGYSGEGIKMISFMLGTTTPITLTSKVNHALNTWAELRAADGTYTAIVEGDEEYGYKVIKKIDMRDKEMWTSEGTMNVSRSETFLLEEGSYYLVSSITTRYGDQNNTAMGRHGSVESKIEYY